MAISKNIFYSFLYISFTLPIFSFAEDVTIITHDFPSKTEKWGENQIGGIAGEIISQAFKHKNITFKIIWEPWIRAQEDCLANTDSKSFIIPFTRNPDREKNIYGFLKSIMLIRFLLAIKEQNQSILSKK